MLFRKRVLRVLVVLSIAFAVGHAVETLRVAPPLASRTADIAAVSPLPELAGITPVAAATERPQDPCTPQLALTAAPQAMIQVALAAPCNLGERVLLRHSGLSFTEQVGLDGMVNLVLPALEESALVAAYFEGSAVALQSVTVPDAAQHPRFGFQIGHPMQFDLRVTDSGRVYSGQGADDAAGPIVTLGSATVRQPLLAQVYSFPGADLSTVDLTVELRITPETCSRSFIAETVLSQDGVVRLAVLPVAVPLCGTAGDILVLKNLVAPPTLALPE